MRWYRSFIAALVDRDPIGQSVVVTSGDACSDGRFDCDAALFKVCDGRREGADTLKVYSSIAVDIWDRHTTTAGFSTSLRSGRNDEFVVCLLTPPPLRGAPFITVLS